MRNMLGMSNDEIDDYELELVGKANDCFGKKSGSRYGRYKKTNNRSSTSSGGSRGRNKRTRR